MYKSSETGIDTFAFLHAIIGFHSINDLDRLSFADSTRK